MIAFVLSTDIGGTTVDFSTGLRSLIVVHVVHRKTDKFVGHRTVESQQKQRPVV